MLLWWYQIKLERYVRKLNSYIGNLDTHRALLAVLSTKASASRAEQLKTLIGHLESSARMAREFRNEVVANLEFIQKQKHMMAALKKQPKNAPDIFLLEIDEQVERFAEEMQEILKSMESNLKCAGHNDRQ